MRRVATSVVEVRGGRVRNYLGNYESYLWAVTKEIDEGERERARANAKAAPAGKSPKKAPRPPDRDERKVRKECTNLERKIARLDEEKNALQQKMLATADADEALRVHTELTAVAQQLSLAEERWFELQAELGELEEPA
jgi:ATP-binding cassette subfamily F protein 3